MSVIIGTDPHKCSATIEIIGLDAKILASGVRHRPGRVRRNALCGKALRSLKD